MLAVGRTRLAASGGLSLPKLSAIVARAIARSGPLASGVLHGPAPQAAFVPFVKANLPLITSIALREYATATKTKKKPAAKKKTTTTKKKAPAKKKATAKKPVKRRVVAKKSGTRRASTKKTAAKKKKPVKKKAVKKKKKVEKPKKPGVMTYHKNALKDEPPQVATAYNLFFVEFYKSNKSIGKIPEVAKACGAKWRALPETEKQTWADRAAVETQKRKAAHQAWIAQHNPVDIAKANKARNHIAALRRAKGAVKTGKYKIKDDRLVAGPRSAYIYFVKENYSRPEVSSLDRNLRMKKLAEFWKAASDADKKKFVDLAARDKLRYQNEKAEFEKKYNKN
ncbi:hypothetical protein TWF696_002394 [Orbilia brochopaga]|uniref:HMG box domain-containing protein n=1 Tax=Orbilia brochopaga TaxID=3140254 RepID=A0AAV9U511_9PEZI